MALLILIIVYYYYGTVRETDRDHLLTPTCVAPRHEDASRYFIYFIFILFYFSPNKQRAGWGGGGEGRFQTFSFFFFFPVQQTTSGIGHRVNKVVFFGLATNALNVRNNSSEGLGVL